MSVVAIAGILYAGKVLSEKPETSTTPPPSTGNASGITPINQQSLQPDPGLSAYIGDEQPTFDMLSGGYIPSGTGFMQKEAVKSFADVTPTSGRNPHGQPVYNLFK